MKQLSNWQGIGLLMFVFNLCLTIRLALEGIPQSAPLFMMGFGLLIAAMQIPKRRTNWLLPLYLILSLSIWASQLVFWHWW